MVDKIDWSTLVSILIASGNRSSDVNGLWFYLERLDSEYESNGIPLAANPNIYDVPDKTYLNILIAMLFSLLDSFSQLCL